MSTEDYRIPSMNGTASQRWLGLPLVEAPWLHEEVGSRMVERLQWFKAQPSHWLDWEPLRGGEAVHRRLRQSLTNAQRRCWGAQPALIRQRLGDPSVPWWKPWQASPTDVMLQGDERFDMVWSNMHLHHVSDPMPLLRRWHSHLGEQGFVMFSCLGPQTLGELRHVYARMGWGAPSHDFTDMHDWGDLLIKAGFAEPVVDMERLQLTFSSARTLVDELRSLGRNLAQARPAGLRGKQWKADLLDALEQHCPRTPDGRLRLSFEIVYGHAHKPLPRLNVSSESTVSLDAMRSMLRSARQTPEGI